MKIKKINNEVIAIDQSMASLDRADILKLVQLAEKNERKRMRICAHSSESDVFQEMFIVHMRDIYVRPHKHLNKGESFLVLEGAVDIFLFNDSGDVLETISMSDYASGKRFYYRLASPIYHSLIVRSEFLIFKEGTTGPFVRGESVFAPWAPDEKDIVAANKFKESLLKKI